MSTDLSELTCPDCGARDQREAFCDSCGAALSRAKAPVAAPAALSPSVPAQASVPAAESIPAPAAATASPSAAEEATSTSDPASASPSESSPLPADNGSDTAELAENARAEAARVAAEKAAAASAARARALLVPVADQSAPIGIVPVLPGVPDPIAPQRKGAEGLDDLDAGIQCQWCGVRNPPERHFCRRCGQRLAYAPVEASRPSWWRRLICIFFWRNRPLPFAGQRPRLRRGPGQAIRPLIWGVVLVVLVVVVAEQYSPTSKNVRDHFAKPNEISNWTVSASRQDPNHQAKLLHDTYSDTWWGSGFSPQNSNGLSVTVNFTQPANLLDLGVTPGAGTAADTFGLQGAPETIEAELIPIPGKGQPTKTTFTLDDQPGFQKFQLRGDDIGQVVLTVTSSYPATSPSADPAKSETAISELEFYSRH
jgi:hypothetical protein